MDNASLLEKAMALYEQEQQQLPTPECFMTLTMTLVIGKK